MKKIRSRKSKKYNLKLLIKRKTCFIFFYIYRSLFVAMINLFPPLSLLIIKGILLFITDNLCSTFLFIGHNPSPPPPLHLPSHTIFTIVRLSSSFLFQPFLSFFASLFFSFFLLLCLFRGAGGRTGDDCEYFTENMFDCLLACLIFVCINHFLIVHLFVYLYVSINLSTYFSIRSIYLPLCPFVCLSIKYQSVPSI